MSDLNDMPTKQQSYDSFVSAVNRSFLSDETKASLYEAAARGVNRRLWGRFNDELIASIVHVSGEEQRFAKNLDEEINRYTQLYEREKTVIDLAFRAELAEIDDEATKQRKWEDYRKKIQDLQARLVKEVQTTSSTVLHEVILATVPASEAG